MIVKIRNLLKKNFCDSYINTLNVNKYYEWLSYDLAISLRTYKYI
jgi:hypothetical protein